MRLAILLAAVCLVYSAKSAKILVFIPFPMKSHHFAFQPIIRELAERGHQITYVTAVPMEKPMPANMRQILVPNIHSEILSKNILPGFTGFGQMPTPQMSWAFSKVGQAVMEATLSTAQAQEIIHSNDAYDLIIHESFFVSEPVTALQHRFGAPGVALMPLADSSWLNQNSGLTDNPSYMIDFKTDFTDKLTFFERLHNTYHLASTLLVSYYHLHIMQGIMDKYFNYTGWETRPAISKLVADQSLILVNSHHSVGYSYPRAPHVKEVGGINLRPVKPLPKDLEKLLDDSPQGVIYFSLGSNINMAEVSSAEIRDAFSKVFGRLKERVLWKWSGKDYPKVPANVHMSDWFPQQDILVHKNIKLFITHGGLLSTTEAVNSAVPLLGIPFFADQRKNLNQVVSAGFGLRLDYENLTEASISWGINEVLNNQKYKQQAVKQMELFKDRVMTPVEESVYWIEYVLRNGKALQPVSVGMPLYQLYMLDVFSAIVVSLIVVTYAAKRIICSLISLCCQRRSFAVVLLASFFAADGARILFIAPFPANSHHAVYRPIIKRLVEVGHHVTYYTPMPMPNQPNSTNLKIVMIPFESTSSQVIRASNSDMPYQMSFHTLIRLGFEAIDASMKGDIFQDLLKSNEKYDMVISGAGFFQMSLSSFAHKFNATNVNIIPVGDVSFITEMAGGPDNPAYMVNVFSPRSDQMNFWERLENVYDWFYIRIVSFYYSLVHYQNTADKYMHYPSWESRPSVTALTSEAALVLLNSHVSVGYAFPKPPHFKEIGGVNVVPSKPLPQDLNDFLDSATDGAIYFSLGSIVQVSDVAGDSVKEAFINVFKTMKQKVLWKWETDNFTDKPANVMTSKWFPQQDVLAHPNVKVFITQGGMMSIFESVARGVPLLGIPFFGDQYKNMKHATTYNYGVQLDRTNLTETSIRWALGELLHNPVYKREAERRAKLFYDRPKQPVDEAIYWIEYVLRHGNALLPQSVYLPFYKLYLLDVIGFLALPQQKHSYFSVLWAIHFRAVCLSVF
ncbi:glucuronosyltransferase [Nesidiocoris tenuis]|uniref:Glucuronosyltransferase n=1 Tax=Nesidiocoris tenuis TaxID=355587 RepID=A0ABN7BI22_9HEMI|nr:glucuronosyltransferase [Nesidiocoris tenuis]